MNYRVYTARKEYKDFNKYLASIDTKDLDSLFIIIKDRKQLNPYYSLITDRYDKVLYNNFLPLNI